MEACLASPTQLMEACLSFPGQLMEACLASHGQLMTVCLSSPRTADGGVSQFPPDSRWRSVSLPPDS